MAALPRTPDCMHFKSTLPAAACKAFISTLLAGALPAAVAVTPAATQGKTQATTQAAERPLACTDFNAYVNGSWEAATELPPNRSRLGSFDTLGRANDKVLETALAQLVAEPARQTSAGLKLLATAYRSGMDTETIERNGLKAVAPLLAQADKATRDTLPVLMGQWARLQLDTPLRLFVGTDAKDATRHVLAAFQGGLGLPDRDDYLNADEAALRLQNAYRVYVQRLLQASGAAADDKTIDALMALETDIARGHMTRAQRRDPNATYNPTTLAQVKAQAPGVDWQAWLAAYLGQRTPAPATSPATSPATASAQQPLMLGQPGLPATLATLAQQAPLEAWRTYLRVRVLDATAERLPKAFADAHFAFHNGVLRGLKTPPPRSESVIQGIGGRYGGSPLAQTLGELFVAQRFSDQAQARAQLMLEDIRAAMRQRIANSPWMSPATQAKARAKLDAMAAKIGRPAKWRDYTGLQLQADDDAGNQLRVAEWDTQQRLADLGRPVDRQRWNTSPHIVNAFAAGGNQIVFPAGILQPPFFDANADDASNYGAIGSVIGHEITHHFDDRGRQFDDMGNLRDWWTAEDAAAYKARAERVVELFGGYEPLPGVRINGRQMLGENISDFGGIHIAYDGLQIALKRARAAGQATPLIDGQTPEQRYFMANALVWRSKMRSEAMLNQLRTGQHSPGAYRVLGPISNMPAFATAFGCKPGDAMVAADPILIW